MNKNPLVSIIIPNFNGEPYLKSCLVSVFKADYENFEVLLIDDGSTDNSLNILKNTFSKEPRLKLILNTTRLGASASRNKGIKEASGEIIFFLDNDTEVDPAFLGEVVTVLLQDTNIGGVTSKIIDFEDRTKIQVAGLKLIPYTMWGVGLGQGEDPLRFNEKEEVVAISAALAVRRDVVSLIGGFDEKLAVFTEDLDFSLRIWIAGYKIVYVPSSIVYHYTKSISMRKGMEDTKRKIYFHLAKNTLRSIVKDYELKNVIKYLPLSLLILIARGLLVLIKRRDSMAIFSTLRAFFWSFKNIRDTLKKRSEVQKTRIVPDSLIFNKIMVKGSRFTIYRRYFARFF